VARATLVRVTGLARQRYSFADYLALESMSTVKHEYLDGAVWAMAGGTPDHAAIAINIAVALSTALRGQPCRVFSADLRVRVKETGLATYPDLSVVCGALETDPDDAGGNTVTNPVLVVEVLSPSTEDYDRGEKLAHYKRIPSLREILLVAQEEARLELWTRASSGWQLEVVRDKGALAVLGCALELAEVYRNPLG
jgi:Uma2 family endonuclease